MKKTNLQNRRGFTIVELVIVIAVIAILAAVLIPTFSGVIQKANESSAKQAVTNAFKTIYNNQMAENKDCPDGLVFTSGDYAYTYFDREMIALTKVAEKKEIELGTAPQLEENPYDNVNKGIIDGNTDIPALFGCYSSSANETILDAIYVMPKGTYTVYSATVGSEEFYFFTTENLLLNDYTKENLKCYQNVFCRKEKMNISADIEAEDIGNQLIYVTSSDAEIKIDFSNPTIITAEKADKYAEQKNEGDPVFKTGNAVSAESFATIMNGVLSSSRSDYRNYYIYFSADSD